MGSISRESYERILLIKREMERLIREFSGLDTDLISESNNIHIPVDIYEVKSEVFIQAEIPGLKKGDIKVFVSKNKLFIEGTKPDSAKEEKVNYIWMERPYGSIKRVIELPQACDTKSITGEYKNGVLTLKLKRIEERRGEKREVEINFED
ncbi:MAG: Hsp20/alpha crystallin family protein [Deltaproteobacteria bacterium]|nr:Hsp20/alpha crystallin family protein [Deltaproteobacteria bacterium]